MDASMAPLSNDEDVSSFVYVVDHEPGRTGIRMAGPTSLAPPQGTWYPRCKRVIDIVGALALLILLLPLFVVVALLIRATSPGPMLFRQRRIGQHCQPFTMYKFRSMRGDADQRVHQEAVRRYIAGEKLAGEGVRAAYKLANDSRITPVGAILRKTSIDELPQLFNVLCGHMSLVGPRPALAYEVVRYSPEEFLRLSVPQGMTGLWQVKGRGRVTWQEALALDVTYVHSCSFATDCKILLLTIPTLIFARGGA